MQVVNLRTLNVDPRESVVTLQHLATSSEGPLRLQRRNGEIYLGVRTWSTYFFEKCIAWDSEIVKAERDTQLAIEQHVRCFLSASGTTLSADRGDEITLNLHTRAINKLVSRPVFVNPRTQSSAAKRAANDSTVRSLDETKHTMANGAILVPKGISFAQLSTVVKVKPPVSATKEPDSLIDRLFSILKPGVPPSPLQVIADVRLVRKETTLSAPAGLLERGTTTVLGQLPSGTLASKNFERFYLGQLNNVADRVKTTIVLELDHDLGTGCSELNITGACNAAEEFIQGQLRRGKHVSVMLAVPALPTLRVLPALPALPEKVQKMTPVGTKKKPKTPTGPDGTQEKRNLKKSGKSKGSKVRQ